MIQQKVQRTHIAGILLRLTRWRRYEEVWMRQKLFCRKQSKKPGEDLDNLVDKSNNLCWASQMFYKQAKKANQYCTIS
ncbi:hypothetical protein M758_1G047400 [Ceratodon purpureus]|uniref:Uncharacterized protein n=1 Tax=Ceratodon purpureus TaxID=3225 RepID=A0A8T0J4Y0_CERPU|nr:hypothetical protein KC19_1G050100 [Ceratodon purpureus]KAG0628716.1 hypothetical protein M758_1G047400 [Ceratodon purpureus]